MTIREGESFERIKSEGDRYYSEGNYAAAIERYSSYIQHNVTASNQELSLIYSNRCACYLQQSIMLIFILIFMQLLIFIFPQIVSLMR